MSLSGPWHRPGLPSSFPGLDDNISLQGHKTITWPSFIHCPFSRKHGTDMLLLCSFTTLKPWKQQITNTRLNTQGGPQCLWLDGPQPLYCAEGVYLETYLKSLCLTAGHCVPGPHLNKWQQFTTTCNGGSPNSTERETWVSASMNNNTTVSQLWPLCLVPGISQWVYWTLWRLFMVTNTQNTTIAASPDATMIGWAETWARL